MATYILFWNPAISSYTMKRFLDDFEEGACVGNWSFHEHEDVDEGDYFYMVRCGEGKVGVVMHGMIYSECYEDEDWSPKGRKPIYYADIYDDITINPETASKMLTPEILTEHMPDFNWYGGHSGRKLSEEYAAILDKLWLEYIDTNPELFEKEEARIHYYDDLDLSPVMKDELSKRIPPACDTCGYDYNKVFGPYLTQQSHLHNNIVAIEGANPRRLLYRICNNCKVAGKNLLGAKLKDYK